ncbi:hypothetical protein MMC12_003052 [Toensbergia leucococca]|nr:hypothetical protein [Toensbergia leucococca]
MPSRMSEWLNAGGHLTSYTGPRTLERNFRGRSAEGFLDSGAIWDIEAENPALQGETALRVMGSSIALFSEAIEYQRKMWEPVSKSPRKEKKMRKWFEKYNEAGWEMADRFCNKPRAVDPEAKRFKEIESMTRMVINPSGWQNAIDKERKRRDEEQCKRGNGVIGQSQLEVSDSDIDGLWRCSREGKEAKKQLEQTLLTQRQQNIEEGGRVARFMKERARQRSEEQARITQLQQDREHRAYLARENRARNRKLARATAPAPKPLP